jgi:micrococcal nuclease
MKVERAALVIATVFFGASVIFLSSPQISAQDDNCDPSYPDVCIPPYPPDLNCPDVASKDFSVLPPDPHGFDRDADGSGCET